MVSRVNVQLLVATMHQTTGDHSLLEKMNIQTDAIICNQCDRFAYEVFQWHNHKIQWFSFCEVGVGLNRNNALMRATGDVVVFCDDDMVLEDGYEEKLLTGFKDNQQADLLIFNIQGREMNKEQNRITRLNYMRYGAARIAARNARLRENGILFHLCFGGGTEHAHGEDNLFLCQCLNRGLGLYTYPCLIARLTDDRPSTWRKTYDEKYFVDQGALYRQIAKNYWRMLCFQDAVRHRKRYALGWLKTYKLMTATEGK